MFGNCQTSNRKNFWRDNGFDAFRSTLFFKKRIFRYYLRRPIERGKFDEAIEIARNTETFSLLTDDAETVGLLNEKAKSENVNLNIFVKIDVGYHRCGVEPNTKEAFEIPQKISDSSNLNFAGILTHAGHSYHADTPEKLLKVAQTERDLMRNLRTNFAVKG